MTAPEDTADQRLQTLQQHLSEWVDAENQLLQTELQRLQSIRARTGGEATARENTRELATAVEYEINSYLG